MKAQQAFAAFSLLGLLGLLGGCATTEVKPWERGTLASEAMRFEARAKLDIVQAKTYAAKEAANGGTGAGGGGCGCN